MTRPGALAAAAWMVVVRVAVLPLGVVQGALLARALLPAGLGRYSALLTDVNLVVTLAATGLPGAISVVLGEERGRLRGLLRMYLRHGGLALVVPGMVVCGVAWRWPGVAERMGRVPVEVTLVFCLCVMQYLRDGLNGLLVGGQYFGNQNWQSIVVGGVQLGLIGGLFVTGRLGVMSALGVQMAGIGVQCLIAGRAIGEMLGSSASASASASTSTSTSTLARRVRSIGWRNLGHIVPDLLLLRIDVYLMQVLDRGVAGRAQLGLYQAGVRLGELVLMVPGALNTVLFAKAAAREEDIHRITVAGAKLSLYLGLLGVVGMAMVGRPLLILFYGPRFAGSFLPCLLVLLGCCAFCFSSPLAGALAGAGAYPRSIIVAQVVALMVNVGANLYLIPRYAAVGAAAASTLAYAISAGIISLAFARRFEMPMWHLLRPESPWRLIRICAASSRSSPP